jgi:predicted adenylyl cyclase CyaB
MRNIELKSRLADLQAARETAIRVATERVGKQHQIDTYFDCRHGRLKLREIDGNSAQLIWYARQDEKGPKASDYLLTPISDPHTLKAALSAALGVRLAVEKHREIFLVDNVRIHLDQVKGLGSFLEFEAVLGPAVDDARGRAQLDELAAQFAIRPDDLVSTSYADLMD